LHDEDVSKDDKQATIDLEEEKRKEAEKYLQQRFKTFEIHLKEISSLLDAWDRSMGNIFRQASPSDRSDHDEHLLTKKNKREAKGD
jgi:hypothetical protein